MPVEIVGQQLRIRVKSPKGATKFGTQDVGSKGKLQRVAGLYKGVWKTQSWRLNLKDYRGYLSASNDLLKIRKYISEAKYRKANGFLRRWYNY